MSILPEIHEGERRRLRNAVSARVYQLTTIKAAQGPLFKALYSALKERYSVDSYTAIKPKDMQDALRFIELWKG